MTMSHTHKWLLGVPGPNNPFFTRTIPQPGPATHTLQTSNNTLKTVEAKSNATDAATKAASSIAQAILTSMPSRATCWVQRCWARELWWELRQSWAVCPIHPYCSHDTNQHVYGPEMKILYALSFMDRGIVQVWAENETNVVLSHMSMFSPSWTLAGIQLRTIKMTNFFLAKPIFFGTNPSSDLNSQGSKTSQNGFNVIFPIPFWPVWNFWKKKWQLFLLFSSPLTSWVLCGLSEVLTALVCQYSLHTLKMSVVS